MDTEAVLTIIKQDLMISSNIRDDYLRTLILASGQELNQRGVYFSNSTDDTLLLADYVAFRYRHRTDDAPLPQNIQLRIAHKKLQRRLQND